MLVKKHIVDLKVNKNKLTSLIVLVEL